MAKLSELGKVITGNTPKTSEADNYSSDDVCFVKPSDLSNEGITQIAESEFHISEAARAKARILPPRSVLVTCIGIIGKVGINLVECAINQQINAIIPNRNKCMETYLAYAIQSKKQEIQSIANAPVVPIINKSQFSDIEIDLPTLDQQTGICKRLNKLDSIINLRQQQLAKLDELVKARFVEMFGDLADPSSVWLSCKLVSICVSSDDIKCGPFGTQLGKDEYRSEGIPIWEIPQINGSFTIKPEHFLTADKAKKLRQYALEPGDIVMSRKGNVGKCALFPDSEQPGILHSDVLRIRVDTQRINPCFMLHQLHYSADVVRQITLVSSGAIMAGVNVTKLKEIYVRIPPFSLQQQFAAFVAQVDKSKVVVQQSLGKLETLKKALMQEYFG